MTAENAPRADRPEPPADPRGRVGLSLKVKLSLFITALVIGAVTLVGVFLLRQAQETLTVEMVKRGRTIAENLAAGAKSSLLANDDLGLNVLVKDAMNDADVAYVAITDEEGAVRAHSDVALIGRPVVRPPGLDQLGDGLQIRTYRAESQGNIVDFSLPLIFSQVRVGALYLGFSDRSIGVALGRARTRALGITAAMVVVGLVAAVALSTVLVRPIFRLVEGTKAIAEGNFHVHVAVTSRDEIGFLTESFNRMARSLREKEMIKRAFTRYVARGVVEEILKDPEKIVLTGERREVTVVFCDIRGFTPMTERLSPDEVVSLLNEFYNLMVETTFKHDGTLDKFLGDAVMAVFGAPMAYPDHAARAVHTALAMRAGVEALSAQRRAAGKEPIAVGIGVSAGEAVAGTVGSEERMEYTVIGDSVNLASRLESIAKPGQILISQRTYDMIHTLVNVRSLGPIKVKGKEEQVDVYELLEVNGNATGRSA